MKKWRVLCAVHAVTIADPCILVTAAGEAETPHLPLQAGTLGGWLTGFSIPNLKKASLPKFPKTQKAPSSKTPQSQKG